MKIKLVGEYPDNTFEKFSALLSDEMFELEAIDTQEKYDAMRDAEVVILRIFKMPKEIIWANPNLKLVLRWGAGYDSVDIEEAGKRGVLVTNTPGANAGAVSEMAILLMLAIGRKLMCHYESLKKGVWSKNTFLNQSYTLNGKLVGIIGAGNIGCQVAAKARAFGAVTQYYDVYRLPTKVEIENKLQYVSFDDLIRTSDIISLHVPLTDNNHHLIGEKEIAEMKKGVIIINTGRGGLIDDHALALAVSAGKVAGAGLDCVENEPLKKDDELLKYPDIIVTPHIGGGTADIGDSIIPMITDNIIALSKGQELSFIVNKRYLKENTLN